MLQYFETLTDDSGNSLLGATVTVTNYPSGSLASIYNTNGTASPVAASTVSSDITGQVSFYVPDGAYTLTYSYKATVYKTKSPVQMIDPLGFVTATDLGAANAYVVTSSAYPASLYTGLKVEFKAANTNTTASTFNLNATGTQPLHVPGGGVLTAGTILAGGIYRLEWDGTQWQFLGSLAQPVLSALQFGAVNDGVTDNTTAINTAIAAIAAAGGGKLYFPGGTYFHSGTLNLVSFVVLEGYGATLTYGGAGNQFASASTGVCVQAGLFGFTLNFGTSGGTQLALNSVYQCNFKDLNQLTNSTTCTCVAFAVNTTGPTNLSGNYDSAYCAFDNCIQNTPAGGNGCGTWISFTGVSASGVSTLNSFNNCSCFLANVYGINFQQWCDSNVWTGMTRIGLNGAISPANGIGVGLSTTAGGGVYSESWQQIAIDAFGSPGVDNRVGFWAAGSQTTKFISALQYEVGSSNLTPFNTPQLQSGNILQAPRNITNYQSMQFPGTNMGLGGFASPGISLLSTVGAQLTGAAQYNYFAQGAAYNAGAPALGVCFGGVPALPSSSGVYTVAQVMGFYAISGTLGTNASATTVYGFYCADQTVGANNYGYYHAVTAGANKVGFYGSGNANNVLNGPLFMGASAGIGLYGNSPPAQLAGFGTPVGGAVVASYNITDAGGANSNTNKAVAQILSTLKSLGLYAA